MASLERLGIRPVAISADTPEESSELMRKTSLSYPILSDHNAEIIKHYDLLLAKGGVDNRDIGSFAEFLLDASGTVRWRELMEGGPAAPLEAAKMLR